MVERMTSDDYQAAAKRYLALAADSGDPEIARLLRILADDCLAEANKKVGQQQQQIQPTESRSDDN